MEGDTEDHSDLDQIVGTILKHLAFLQHSPSQATSICGNLLFAVIFIIALQPIIAVCTNWQHWNFNSRVSAIDNLIFSLGAFCLSVDVYLLSKKLLILVKLTKSGYQLYSICSRASRDFRGDKKSEKNTILDEKIRSSATHDFQREDEDSETEILEENVCSSMREDFHGEKNSEDNIIDGKVVIGKISYSKADELGKMNSYDSENNDLFYKKQEYVEETTMKGCRRSGNINSFYSRPKDFCCGNQDSFNENLEYVGRNQRFSQGKLEYATQTTVEGFRRSSGMNQIINSGNNAKTNDFWGRNENEERKDGMATNSGNNSLKNNYFLEKKQRLIKEITLEGSRRGRTTANVLKYFFISFTLIPLSGIVNYLFRFKSIEDLPLPFLIYSPFSFTLEITSFFEYFLLALVELFYIYYTAVLAITVHVLQLLSINNLLGEMRLFHLNARELDALFENVPNGVQSREKVLRLAARELVIHHQTIFRKVKQLNQGSNFRIFYANSYICLQIVFGIFIFLKGDFLYKIKYGLMVITITLLEYIFSENGQKLQDEGEQLRIALYECNWVGTPAWFTKALQIMIIRNNDLPKVGLLNLFTLNRNNVTVVIRGAYSYFSLLNKISS